MTLPGYLLACFCVSGGVLLASCSLNKNFDAPRATRLQSPVSVTAPRPESRRSSLRPGPVMSRGRFSITASPRKISRLNYARPSINTSAGAAVRPIPRGPIKKASMLSLTLSQKFTRDCWPRCLILTLPCSRPPGWPGSVQPNTKSPRIRPYS